MNVRALTKEALNKALNSRSAKISHKVSLNAQCYGTHFCVNYFEQRSLQASHRRIESNWFLSILTRRLSHGSYRKGVLHRD